MKRKQLPKNERLRLLRALSKQPATLEWPCRNEMLRSMVEQGAAEITHRWNEQWGGREHSCAKIAITGAGREELTSHEEK